MVVAALDDAARATLDDLEAVALLVPGIDMRDADGGLGQHAVEAVVGRNLGNHPDSIRRWPVTPCRH